MKTFAAISLVAGTSIGAGVLALPIVFAQVGVFGTVFFMLLTWGVAYFTALVSLELNLQAGSGHALGALGKRFSGTAAQVIGSASVKMLCYALFAAYLCGCADVGAVIVQTCGLHIESSVMKHISALVIGALLLTNVHVIAKFNQLLFIMVCVILLLSIVAVFPTKILNTAALSASLGSFSVFAVLFTSFGFQVIFHTLSDCCKGDKVVLRKAFFWGTLIPLLLYFFWTAGVLLVIAESDAVFYKKMLKNAVQLSDMMTSLAQALDNSGSMGAALLRGVSSGAVFWALSLLAILTSIIGVGVGLATDWSKALQSSGDKKSPQRACVRSVLITVVPSWLMSTYYPGLFIGFLGFAGCVLTVIALFLPIYLLHQQRKEKNVKAYYTIVDNKALQAISVIFGLTILLTKIGVLC
ncbi:MAG: hypothetical protein OXC30_01475 [Alphaproteobacteria bacterium]|nr:hypothetical protein [Alphaproteobacteria bacterium]